MSAPAPTREEYYRILADNLPAETLVVTSLGNASYLWASLRDRPENFYIEDCMGLALPLALGVAAALPERKVVCAEGDGGLLMHLGALVTAGAVAPENLTVLVAHNHVYASSGGQPLTHQQLDLAGIARMAGFRAAESVATAADFKKAFPGAFDGEGPALLALAMEPDPQIVVPPFPFNPIVIKQRFMDAVDAPAYVPSRFDEGRRVAP